MFQSSAFSTSGSASSAGAARPFHTPDAGDTTPATAHWRPNGIGPLDADSVPMTAWQATYREHSSASAAASPTSTSRVVSRPASGVKLRPTSGASRSSWGDAPRPTSSPSQHARAISGAAPSSSHTTMQALDLYQQPAQWYRTAGTARPPSAGLGAAAQAPVSRPGSSVAGRRPHQRQTGDPPLPNTQPTIESFLSSFSPASSSPQPHRRTTSASSPPPPELQARHDHMRRREDERTWLLSQGLLGSSNGRSSATANLMSRRQPSQAEDEVLGTIGKQNGGTVTALPRVPAAQPYVIEPKQHRPQPPQPEEKTSAYAPTPPAAAIPITLDMSDDMAYRALILNQQVVSHVGPSVYSFTPVHIRAVREEPYQNAMPLPPPQTARPASGGRTTTNRPQSSLSARGGGSRPISGYARVGLAVPTIPIPPFASTSPHTPHPHVSYLHSAMKAARPTPPPPRSISSLSTNTTSSTPREIPFSQRRGPLGYESPTLGKKRRGKSSLDGQQTRRELFGDEFALYDELTLLGPSAAALWKKPDEERARKLLASQHDWAEYEKRKALWSGAEPPPELMMPPDKIGAAVLSQEAAEAEMVQLRAKLKELHRRNISSIAGVGPGGGSGGKESGPDAASDDDTEIASPPVEPNEPTTAAIVDVGPLPSSTGRSSPTRGHHRAHSLSSSGRSSPDRAHSRVGHTDASGGRSATPTRAPHPIVVLSTEAASSTSPPRGGLLPPGSSHRSPRSLMSPGQSLRFHEAEQSVRAHQAEAREAKEAGAKKREEQQVRVVLADTPEVASDPSKKNERQQQQAKVVLVDASEADLLSSNSTSRNLAHVVRSTQAQHLQWSQFDSTALSILAKSPHSSASLTTSSFRTDPAFQLDVEAALAIVDRVILVQSLWRRRTAVRMAEEKRRLAAERRAREMVEEQEQQFFDQFLSKNKQPKPSLMADATAAAAAAAEQTLRAAQYDSLVAQTERQLLVRKPSKATAGNGSPKTTTTTKVSPVAPSSSTGGESVPTSPRAVLGRARSSKKRNAAVAGGGGGVHSPMPTSPKKTGGSTPGSPRSLHLGTPQLSASAQLRADLRQSLQSQAAVIREMLMSNAAKEAIVTRHREIQVTARRVAHNQAIMQGILQSASSGMGLIRPRPLRQLSDEEYDEQEADGGGGGHHAGSDGVSDESQANLNAIGLGVGLPDDGDAPVPSDLLPPLLDDDPDLARYSAALAQQDLIPSATLAEFANGAGGLAKHGDNLTGGISNQLARWMTHGAPAKVEKPTMTTKFPTYHVTGPADAGFSGPAPDLALVRGASERAGEPPLEPLPPTEEDLELMGVERKNDRLLAEALVEVKLTPHDEELVRLHGIAAELRRIFQQEDDITTVQAIARGKFARRRVVKLKLELQAKHPQMLRERSERLSSTVVQPKEEKVTPEMRLREEQRARAAREERERQQRLDDAELSRAMQSDSGVAIAARGAERKANGQAIAEDAGEETDRVDEPPEHPSHHEWMQVSIASPDGSLTSFNTALSPSTKDSWRQKAFSPEAVAARRVKRTTSRPGSQHGSRSTQAAGHHPTTSSGVPLRPMPTAGTPQATMAHRVSSMSVAVDAPATSEGGQVATSGEENVTEQSTEEPAAAAAAQEWVEEFQLPQLSPAELATLRQCLRETRILMSLESDTAEAVHAAAGVPPAADESPVVPSEGVAASVEATAGEVVVDQTAVPEVAEVATAVIAAQEAVGQVLSTVLDQVGLSGEPTEQPAEPASEAAPKTIVANEAGEPATEKSHEATPAPESHVDNTAVARADEDSVAVKADEVDPSIPPSDCAPSPAPPASLADAVSDFDLDQLVWMCGGGAGAIDFLRQQTPGQIGTLEALGYPIPLVLDGRGVERFCSILREWCPAAASSSRPRRFLPTTPLLLLALEEEMHARIAVAEEAQTDFYAAIEHLPPHLHQQEASLMQCDHCHHATSPAEAEVWCVACDMKMCLACDAALHAVDTPSAVHERVSFSLDLFEQAVHDPDCLPPATPVAKVGGINAAALQTLVASVRAHASSSPLHGVTRARTPHTPRQRLPFRSVVCDWCEELHQLAATVWCQLCQMKLCLAHCDEEVHQMQGRHQHERTPYQPSAADQVDPEEEQIEAAAPALSAAFAPPTFSSPARVDDASSLNIDVEADGAAPAPEVSTSAGLAVNVSEEAAARATKKQVVSLPSPAHARKVDHDAPVGGHAVESSHMTPAPSRSQAHPQAHHSPQGHVFISTLSHDEQAVLDARAAIVDCIATAPVRDMFSFLRHPQAEVFLSGRDLSDIVLSGGDVPTAIRYLHVLAAQNAHFASFAELPPQMWLVSLQESEIAEAMSPRGKAVAGQRTKSKPSMVDGGAGGGGEGVDQARGGETTRPGTTDESARIALEAQSVPLTTSVALGASVASGPTGAVLPVDRLEAAQIAREWRDYEAQQMAAKHAEERAVVEAKRRAEQREEERLRAQERYILHGEEPKKAAAALEPEPLTPNGEVLHTFHRSSATSSPAIVISAPADQPPRSFTSDPSDSVHASPVKGKPTPLTLDVSHGGGIYAQSLMSPAMLHSGSTAGGLASSPSAPSVALARKRMELGMGAEHFGQTPGAKFPEAIIQEDADGGGVLRLTYPFFLARPHFSPNPSLIRSGMVAWDPVHEAISWTFAFYRPADLSRIVRLQALARRRAAVKEVARLRVQEGRDAYLPRTQKKRPKAVWRT